MRTDKHKLMQVCASREWALHGVRSSPRMQLSMWASPQRLPQALRRPCAPGSLGCGACPTSPRP